MDYFSKDFTPPSGLIDEAEDMYIFPTSLASYKQDHEAVMASRDMLRIWGGDSWPEDSFTAEENRNDLQYHVQDNEEHAAYGYMIFNCEKTTCLGSVYVNPIGAFRDSHQVVNGAPPWDGHWAFIAFWVRSDVPWLEAKVFAVLSRWLKREWPKGYLWMSRPLLTARNDMFGQKGMKLLSEIRSSGGAPMLLYKEI